MIGTLRDIAVAASTSAVLAGSAVQAQSGDFGATLDLLNLPMGEKAAVYFNAATQTVITEKCYADIQRDRTVVCDMSVLANAAIMNLEQQIIYTQDKNGNLLIMPDIASQGSWNTQNDGGDYKKLKAQATIAAWGASSPLAETDSNGVVIQNNVRKAELVGDRARAWSYMPISENRGIFLTQSFEDKTEARFSFEMMVAAGNGSVLSAPSDTASRPYIEGDYDFVERYYRNSLIPSYTVE